MVWSDLEVLITGGTGTIGHALVERILEQNPKRLVIFSRDEWKQNEMRKRWPDEGTSRIRYFIGDVRSRERLQRAFYGIDIVLHAAALKQVPACEYNPEESVLTNIQGALNVIDAALETEVQKVLLISSDKACAPINTYGACKAVAEKVFTQGNAYSGKRRTRFGTCRYGNVMGSRGSVIPLFREQARAGCITLTDRRMSRFWITPTQALDLIEHSIMRMSGGEIFVPCIPSCRLEDLAEAIAPGVPRRVTGIRPGEKLHETLITEDEARRTLLCEGVYVIQPEHPWWTGSTHVGTPVPEGWSYVSRTNEEQLTVDQMRRLLEDI